MKSQRAVDLDFSQHPELLARLEQAAADGNMNVEDLISKILEGASFSDGGGLHQAEQPIWIRRKTAFKVFGVGHDILDDWVRDDKVEAHKLSPGKNGSVVFSASDISRVIRSSPKYVPSCRVAV